PKGYAPRTTRWTVTFKKLRGRIASGQVSSKTPPVGASAAVVRDASVAGDEIADSSRLGGNENSTSFLRPTTDRIGVRVIDNRVPKGGKNVNRIRKRLVRWHKRMGCPLRVR